MAQSIGLSFAEKAGLRHAMMFLSKFGIGGTLAVKIHEMYKDRLYAIVEENPYELTESINGVGFKTADEIAEKAGIGRHSEHRIRAGIIYAISLSEGDGNVFLPERELVDRASTILSVGQDEVEYAVESLCMERRIVKKASDEGINIYSERFYRIEEDCAALLFRLLMNMKGDESTIIDEVTRIEEKECLFLADNQRSAVFGAIENSIFIMTGGPGTGKTTTIRVLIRYFLSKGKNVCLAAPTGRATPCAIRRISGRTPRRTWARPSPGRTGRRRS